MDRIIQRDRSIIPACDVDLARFDVIVRETCGLPTIGAYKIGAALALSAGLPRVVETARKHTDKPLIYDHQKAGTDIPDTGKQFTELIKASRIDALIIFPLAGPSTETAWIHAAQEVGLPVIVGGHMTHEQYLSSEDGYINDNAPETMFSIAASNGISNFVVPGNKPSVIKRLRTFLDARGITPTFYAPGFISQGGKISEAAEAAGPRWHAIVGRGIYEAADVASAAADLGSRL